MAFADSIGFLGEADVLEFEELLDGLIRETQVDAALLCDRTGRLLCARGDTHGMDRTSFASLVAGDFGASDQLAGLLGETEFTSLYHHGPDRSMFLTDLAGTAILAVLFDNRTTLGMVRIRTRTVVPRFVSLFEGLAARGPAGRLVQLEQGWANEAETAIDDLFNDQ
jgi:predicted regulator of Ras-like GTPase activity (Roadblock/LC7/MglB family)